MNRELARIIGCYICLHSAMAGTRMAAPLLALTLGIDKAFVGILIAFFALPQIVLALPAGRLADRKGLKKPVIASVIAATCSGAIAAALPRYPALCVAALCSGTAMALAAIALQRHCGRAARNAAELKNAFGWLSTAPALSNFVGPFAAGLVIDHLGYRAAFMLLGCLPIVGWVSISGAREAAAQTHDAPDSGSAWSLWRQPWFGRLLMLNWFSAASFDVHGFVVPVLGHERGFSASVIGAILGSFAIAAAASRVALPIFASRMREWTLIAGALGLGALVFMLYPFAKTPITMGLCSAAIGMTIGAVQPIVMALLHQTAPPHRHGDAVAMRHLMINASSVAMPMLLGLFAGTFGVAALFWVMGVAVGSGVPMGLSLRRIELDPSHRPHPPH